jgi:ribosomal protein L37AE/L43A
MDGASQIKRASSGSAFNQTMCKASNMLENQNAWSVIAKDPSELSWGSHDGYDDRLEEYYNYDSNVGNSRNVQVGDLIFVRGNDYVIGFGQVESIHSRPGTKELRKCPKCKSSPESRKLLTPKWRCPKCKHEFNDDEIVIEVVDVVKYTASYANTWLDANLPMTRQEAFAFQSNNDNQSAIRQLKISKVPDLILKLTGVTSSSDLQNSYVPDLIIGGTTISVTKRRRGQQEFRLALLRKLGESCFVSGAQPACVLEAAHISPFSTHETHSVEGGLLLRRDLHTLFDRHLLRINPQSWTVETAPQLHPYKNYYDLHLKQLVLDHEPDVQLIEQHYEKASEFFAA